MNVCHFKSPYAPNFRFEYHPLKKKVYMVRIGATPEIGEVFAHDIENEGAAHNAVLIWLRGYRTANGDRWNENGKLITMGAAA
jgi:hypothetical protein